MEQQQILGDREKGKIDELLEKAGKDKLVKEVVEKGKEKPKLEKKEKDSGKEEYSRPKGFKLLPCAEAGSIIRGIKNHICFNKETGLVYAGIGEESVEYTLDNALLSAAYSAAGNKKAAKKLIANIEEHIEHVVIFDDNYHLFCMDTFKPDEPYIERCDEVHADANLAMAAAYIAAGKKEKGLELIKEVEEYGGFLKVGKNRKLFGENNINKYERYSGENALLAYAYSLIGKTDDAMQILEAIEEDIGYYSVENEETGLIRTKRWDREIETKDTALYALACFALGNEERGRKLLRAVWTEMEPKIFGDNSMLFKEDFEYGRFLTAPSAAMALAHMAEAFYNDRAI